MYRPIIMVGDVFQTNNPEDHYRTSKLIVTKVVDGNTGEEHASPMPQPLWIKGSNDIDNQWVYFKLDPPLYGDKEDKCRFWWLKDHCHRILTHDEKSILLYAEACLVDSNGLMKSVKMNTEDLNCLKRFKLEGLLDYGRIPFHEIKKSIVFANTHWVTFTEEAWTITHNLRRERAIQRPLSESYKNEKED